MKNRDNQQVRGAVFISALSAAIGACESANHFFPSIQHAAPQPCKDKKNSRNNSFFHHSKKPQHTTSSKTQQNHPYSSASQNNTLVIFGCMSGLLPLQTQRRILQRARNRLKR
jgi:hypothetical protein